MEHVNQIIWRARAAAEQLSKLVTPKRLQNHAKIGSIVVSTLATGTKDKWWTLLARIAAMALKFSSEVNCQEKLSTNAMSSAPKKTSVRNSNMVELALAKITIADSWSTDASMYQAPTGISICHRPEWSKYLQSRTRSVLIWISTRRPSPELITAKPWKRLPHADQKLLSSTARSLETYPDARVEEQEFLWALVIPNGVAMRNACSMDHQDAIISSLSQIQVIATFGRVLVERMA